VLDTNAAIALLDGDPGMEQFVEQADAVYLSSIVIGELYFGAEKSARAKANVARVELFASRRSVLVCDLATARQYGRISQKLRAKGRPIPQSDKWIAAIALQHNLTLVTRDAHFKLVDGLKVETW
jgi:tRNA(fMet)-specific endonuclease VapC